MPPKGELEKLIRSLAPGERYHILLQPMFESGQRVTLGSSFVVTNDPDMEALMNHYNSIIRDR